MKNFPPIDEQIARLRRGTVDFVDEKELRKKLERSEKTGRPLRVKYGIDPSSPDIHLGHTVPLRRLREFQELGHTAVVIWGTATAMVGDPTGRDKTRPQLARDQVEANLETYKTQIGKVLDVERIEHRRNSEWFDEMGFMGAVELLSRMTVARAIERDSFEKRMKAGLPVSLHEIIYPLLQGWDSVAIEADVELGGSDQLFNLLVGRDFQQQEGQEPQVCMTTPIIEGLDGEKKMSKSLGNSIGVADAAVDMFGKVMSLPDALMEKYFLLLTEVPEAEVVQLLAAHPRETKVRLGKELVSWLHDPTAADEAAAEFDRVFKDRALPTDIAEITLPVDVLREGTVLVATAVARAGLAASGGEARRAMPSGGVKIDGEPVTDIKAALSPGRYLCQVGKRKFAYVTVLAPQ
ncbi:MAG: tyrosine--tRNA ligase [Planctomycetota bacterium]|nr:tyrosine--tRNA ligase [Planctomycetota bacterium]